MESFLNRYRNITVLLLVIFAQLVLLAVQVKNDQDVRLVRVWTVTAVTPAARVIEWMRGGSIGFLRDYIMLHNADEDNRRLRGELGRLKMENIFLKNQLATAERAKALEVFQQQSPSKMVAANVIGTGAGFNSKVVFVNRGTGDGVMRGMGVVTPEGIVGKVVAAYPTASEVVLVTDPEFAAGVSGQKSGARGTLKGQGEPLCRVDYVPIEEKVEVGEWFYTSGDDRIFPRGLPVGTVKAVRNGQSFKDILLEPSGLQHGPEDVLIILSGVHEDIPPVRATNQPVYVAPPPPESANQQAAPAPTGPAGPVTAADKLRAEYQALGQAENHNYGEGPPGSKPPDFTKLGVAAPAAGAAAAPPGAKPAAPAPAPKAPPGVPGEVTPAKKPAPVAQPEGAAPPNTAPAGPAQKAAPDAGRRQNQAAGKQ